MQLAQGVSIGSAWPLSGGDGKGGFGTLSDIITKLLPKALLLGGIIMFIIAVLAGFALIAGTGDKQATEKGKSVLTYAVIGFIFMFGAYWVLQIINYVTGGALGDILG